MSGVPLPAAAPVLLAVVFGLFGFFLPDLALRGEAEQRRRDFRHVVGAFLDLVAMNLAGGRGLPEALLAASTIGDHWSMVRIRQALANARLFGMTPWDALGELGDDIGVEELRDLSGALAWRPTTAPRSAPRCRPAPPRCGARSSPSPRARPASGRSRCWWRRC